MNSTANTSIGFYCKQKVGTHCGVGMVFSINAKTTGDKTMVAYKQLAININGTGTPGAIQSVQPGAAAIASTVTVLAGGAGATGGAVATGTAAAAASTASVVAGQGVGADGNTCACSCLCGVNDFPAAAAVNNFGGFAGTLG
jgi:hypothetical protein